jgi:hypothetical protein
LGKRIEREYALTDFLRRPGVSYDADDLAGRRTAVRIRRGAQVEVSVKYAGYIDRQHEEVARHSRRTACRFRPTLDYREVRGLSNEVRQKLIAVKPGNDRPGGAHLGRHARAISLLLVHLKRGATAGASRAASRRAAVGSASRPTRDTAADSRALDALGLALRAAARNSRLPRTSREVEQDVQT